ncbi:MAG: HAD family hydrolase [Fimbriiglobus sp.]|jgi:FMN phosphatase YigB (HAD superfamily)|nr:HAD family hydrolase [Fimbriiglobus sp.]
MPLSLEQYVCEHLPGKPLPWPAPPAAVPVKAKPSVERLPVKAVLWTVYGTLVAVPGGELAFESDIDFVTDAALDKTIQEFKMWNSMSRKPGAPSAYMKELYRKAFDFVRLTGGGEITSELIWDDIFKKLLTKEYSYDSSLYGPPTEFVKKIAYFYHASIQGAGCYPGAADALRMVSDAGVKQGLLADGQCFTPAQLRKCLREQDPTFSPAMHLANDLRVLSADHKVKKPSEELFRAAVAMCRAKGITPDEVLHVGSDVLRDIAPAKKVGFRTALFAGDKNSLKATGEQVRDPHLRPDVLLTELPQIAQVVG